MNIQNSNPTEKTTENKQDHNQERRTSIRSQNSISGGDTNNLSEDNEESKSSSRSSWRETESLLENIPNRVLDDQEKQILFNQMVDYLNGRQDDITTDNSDVNNERNLGIVTSDERSESHESNSKDTSDHLNDLQNAPIFTSISVYGNNLDYEDALQVKQHTLDDDPIISPRQLGDN